MERLHKSVRYSLASESPEALINFALLFANRVRDLHDDFELPASITFVVDDDGNRLPVQVALAFDVRDDDRGFDVVRYVLHKRSMPDCIFYGNNAGDIAHIDGAQALIDMAIHRQRINSNAYTAVLVGGLDGGNTYVVTQLLPPNY